MVSRADLRWHPKKTSIGCSRLREAAKYSGITPKQAKEDNTKLKELFSVADVLNYLSGRSWDLVSVSTLLSEVNYPEPSSAVRSVTATARSEV